MAAPSCTDVGVRPSGLPGAQALCLAVFCKASFPRFLNPRDREPRGLTCHHLTDRGGPERGRESSAVVEGRGVGRGEGKGGGKVGGGGGGERRASPDVLLGLLGLRQLLSGLPSRALGSASSWAHLSQASPPDFPPGV